MPFEPVKDNELQVGASVPWSLYDKSGNLLLARGKVIESYWQLEQLSTRGIFRKLHIGSPRCADGDDQPTDAAAAQERLTSFDAIGLACSAPLHLQSQAEGVQSRYAVKLIGYLPGKSIVVTTPVQDGKVLLMREGQSFVVRCFSGKSVYAFAANTFKVANVPYPHLHLTYPAQVKGLVVRRSARADVKLISAVRNERGATAAASLEDLSTGGCSLVAKEALGENGESLAIKFRVKVGDVEQYLNLDGRIRSVRSEAVDDAAPRQVRHGVQFASIDPSDHIALTAFVYQALHAQHDAD